MLFGIFRYYWRVQDGRAAARRALSWIKTNSVERVSSAHWHHHYLYWVFWEKHQSTNSLIITWLECNIMKWFLFSVSKYLRTRRCQVRNKPLIGALICFENPNMSVNFVNTTNLASWKFTWPLELLKHRWKSLTKRFLYKVIFCAIRCWWMPFGFNALFSRW